MEKLVGTLVAILAVTGAGFVSYLVLQSLAPRRAALKIEGRAEREAPGTAGREGGRK